METTRKAEIDPFWRCPKADTSGLRVSRKLPDPVKKDTKQKASNIRHPRRFGTFLGRTCY